MQKSRKKSQDNKINILLTRPFKDSIKVSKALNKNHFKAFIAPLIEIRKKKYTFSLKKKFEFVIFTSRNAIFNFKESLNENIRIITIGDGTYNLAKQMGMNNLINVKGNIEDLKKKMKSFLKVNSEIIHPTSADYKNDLKDFFANIGCSYSPIFCYNSKLSNSRPEIFVNFFKSCKYGLITLFSRRTAISFRNEIKKYGFLENCKDKKILVLSKAIGDEVKGMKTNGLFISKHPNERSMLDLIYEIKEKEF